MQYSALVSQDSGTMTLKLYRRSHTEMCAGRVLGTRAYESDETSNPRVAAWALARSGPKALHVCLWRNWYHAGRNGFAIELMSQHSGTLVFPGMLVLPK